MPDRRRDARARAAVERLELYRRLHPGGMSLTEPFEGVRLGFVEQLVAALYADGLSVEEIADAVRCAPRTAKKHLELIGRKVEGQPGATRRARITGWVRARRQAATEPPLPLTRPA